MKPFWQSKKWLMATVGALIPAINSWIGLGLYLATVLTILVPIVGYLGGQGLADFGKYKAG